MSVSEPLTSVLLYDGECGFCDAFVQFVLRHDAAGHISFLALQSPRARAILRRAGRSEIALDTVVFIDPSGVLLDRSDAVIAVLGLLGGWWRFTHAFRVVPRPVRDAGYALFARYRYALFGKLQACSLPAPEIRLRFLDPEA